MELPIVRAARAFSSHAFTDAYPHLSPDVRWELIGGRAVKGKDAVIAACEKAVRELAGAATAFTRFDVFLADSLVIIRSEATYVDAGGGRSEVASCDIYETAHGAIDAISSYNIELAA